MVRLAYGVVTGRDQRVWDARGHLLPSGRSGPSGAEAATGAQPGAPVVLGPAPTAEAPVPPTATAEAPVTQNAAGDELCPPIATAEASVPRIAAGELPVPRIAAGGSRLQVAVAELARLVESGGVMAAGAGVELCPGFVSARLAGARGDRRDAVLAAIEALGLDGLHRLGERAGVLVALFGAEATKPVAAAASRAIADGRWAALRLASAASGVLGAEQLERLLHLGAEPPERLPHLGAPPSRPEPAAQAPASGMAEHLGRVLGAYPQRRRLDLLLDLWDQVAARQEAGRRKERRLATQGKQSRLAELTARYTHHEDEFLLEHVRRDVGHEPTLVEAARWSPQAWHWTQLMNRAMHNAMAATVLLRTAVAVADHGVVEGVARSAGGLVAAAALMDSHEAGAAARRVPGMAGLPARPGCYVRDLAARLSNPSETYVRQRLARAGEYALVVMDAVADLILEADEQLHGWSIGGMREWRAAVGYTAQRLPSAWAQPPVDGERRRPLEERLAERPGVPPEEEETAGDLLWFAELADALAQLNGHERAQVDYDAGRPYADPDPAPDEPALDSIPAALAGAAQLVSLGGQPPRQCRGWAELTAGLTRSVEVAQAFTTAFRVPEPLAAADGTLVPGTDARLEWARHPRALAQWSAYMGNCIAGTSYVEEATKGTCALAALRGPSGRIVANLEVRRRRQGWQIVEFRARFNADPDPVLSDGVTRWLASLPPPPLLEPSGRERIPSAPPRRRRLDRLFREVSGPLAELADRALTHPATVDALSVLDTMRIGARPKAASTAPGLPPTGASDARGLPPAGATAHGLPTDVLTAHGLPTDVLTAHGLPTDVLTALRRLSADRIERVCLDALPETGLPDLWHATGARPLAQALAGLDPELAARYDHLRLLTADAPLPGSLRKLARHGAIAPARSMELVARRIRAALGRLARAGDPVLARQVVRRPGQDVLCSLVLAVTAWPGAGPENGPQRGPQRGPQTVPQMVPVTEPGKASVPGYPRTDLEDPDGPWRLALPGAVELGADAEGLWERVSAGGLRVPAAWLGNGGWPALWQRAARARRP
ncbi:hypothetical protein [Nonomuraea sp. JJY05]|uniref:hypothetical protein n=1 Tax=Nonomuraea sp. JJY05 TaxID=3350255 RepID=UPI00373FB488